MKRITLPAFLVLVLASFDSVYAARVVDYSIDEATAQKNADEQALAPLVKMPEKSHFDFVVVMAPAVDHEVIRGGIACSAWTVQNPISQIIRKVFTASDADGDIGQASGHNLSIIVHIDSAATFSRCVLSGEMAGVCITRVSITGATIEAGQNHKSQPFRVEVERSAKSIGACAGLTRGIGLISREAAIALISTVASRIS